MRGRSETELDRLGRTLFRLCNPGALMALHLAADPSAVGENEIEDLQGPRKKIWGLVHECPAEDIGPLTQIATGFLELQANRRQRGDQ